MTDGPLRERARLYLITPATIEDARGFRDTLMGALDGGDVACLQIRLKSGTQIDTDATRRVAERVIEPVQAAGIAVVMNDSPELALEFGADGVHLGADDPGVKTARATLGPDAIIGATCKASRHLAMVAGEAGADYVAFGSFHPTRTKPDATPADPDILTIWQETMALPCVAIGGITVDRAAPLVEAGADFLAVSAGVWAHPDGPGAAIGAFNQVFDAAHEKWAQAASA